MSQTNLRSDCPVLHLDRDILILACGTHLIRVDDDNIENPKTIIRKMNDSWDWEMKLQHGIIEADP